MSQCRKTQIFLALKSLFLTKIIKEQQRKPAFETKKRKLHSQKTKRGHFGLKRALLLKIYKRGLSENENFF